MSELPPLPDDVAALLKAAEHGAPPPPPGLEAAVLAKVSATVAVPAAAAASTTLFGTAVAAKPLAALVVAVGLTGAGAGVVLATRDAPASVVAPAPAAPTASRTRPAFVEPAVVEPDIAEARVEDAIVVDAGVEARVERRPSEQALLEAARDALARGDADAALAKLREHARSHPRGKLHEERRALTVVAHAQRGEREQATRAARAFEREHPDSLFLEMVRAAVVDEGGTP